MSWALKFFSLKSLLYFCARTKLGDALWKIIRDAVRAAEAESPMGGGGRKFARVLSSTRAAVIPLGLEVGNSLLRWGIETAVDLLEEKTA